MPTRTGTEIVTRALKELGVLGPADVASGPELQDGLDIGTDLLDSWRTERLLIPFVTPTDYDLVANTQDYTIGSGGTWNQTYPYAIERWSVIPDDDAANPLEIPMGQPVPYEVWQQIGVKSTTGSHPTTLYFDRNFASGLGQCSVYPIPDNGNVDVRLYQAIPELTSLVAATEYDLRPGAMRAIITNLALELADGYGSAAVVSPLLVQRAQQSKGSLKRGNRRPKETPLRPEYVIGGGRRRSFNVYTDQ
jgi:hypothetical protein